MILSLKTDAGVWKSPPIIGKLPIIGMPIIGIADNWNCR